SAPTGATGTSAPTGPPVKVGLVYDIGGRGDKSFNDSAAAGLDKAKQDFNIDSKELAPNSGGTNRADLLNLLATQGYQLVIGVGFLYAPTIGAAAAQYPDVDWADVDGFIDHTTCDTCTDDYPKNLTSLLFAENEGAYLVGCAAALKSKTKHVGFIGGVNIALINKFQAGFDAGVEKCGPGTKVDHTYISQPPDFSGFNDPAKAQTIAQGMYQGGADVVYHAAGGSGAGLFAAAEAFSKSSGGHVWAIGTDADQYLSAPKDQQPYILTSNLKRVDTAVYETIKNFVNGTFKNGVQTFDLKADGVGYATSGGFVDDIKSQLDDLAAQIKSGQIKVPATLSG
ncbi:MAG TPA: BMP family ABC transporter substrate-binding protein, partial [Actinomycetota bacterium]|nr:BMP family ABC transporter substrate-binding protein [Actinomycetota bacterium]